MPLPEGHPPFSSCSLRSTGPERAPETPRQTLPRTLFAPFSSKNTFLAGHSGSTSVYRETPVAVPGSSQDNLLGLHSRGRLGLLGGFRSARSGVLIHWNRYRVARSGFLQTIVGVPREVLNGVGADGVRSEIPNEFLPVNCCCSCPCRFFRRSMGMNHVINSSGTYA